MILQGKNFNTNLVFVTNVIFGFFPISFILGNFITNINLILLCFLGILHLKSKILEVKFDLSLKIIFLFFFIIFFSTGLSFVKSLYFEGYEYINLIRLIKSLVFFRFFLLLIIICLLSEYNILNFKYFLISATFVPILLSLDIIYQYNFGYDIIGLKNFHTYNSGFFGDELIAGGFIKNFSFFSIFFIIFKLKNTQSLRFILTIFTICILGVGILLSGNRMPLLLFFLGLFLTYLFNINFKKILLTGLVVLLTIFSVIFTIDNQIKAKSLSFVGNAQDILSGSKFKRLIPNEIAGQEAGEAPSSSWAFQEHLKTRHKGSPLKSIYSTSIDTWKKNKVFGNGIKSFREDCKKFPLHTGRLCSSHPHNYYLEILTETGIVGIVVTFLIALLFLIFIFKYFKFFNESSIENLILCASIISLIIEVFPIRTTGSIFTTNNATYLILMVSIMLSCKKKINLNRFI